MAKTYHLGRTRRLVNRLINALLATPLAPPHTVLLTVTGRTTGRRYSTPVRLIERDGQRFLVAPYGTVSWVRNARAAGQVTLSRNGRSETLAVTACPPAETGAILREYARTVPVTRPYFDARPDDPPQRFAAEAAAHPVFRIGAAVANQPAAPPT